MNLETLGGVAHNAASVTRDHGLSHLGRNRAPRASLPRVTGQVALVLVAGNFPAAVVAKTNCRHALQGKRAQGSVVDHLHV
jgi:hypothetical protein